ncbi:MAG: prepilin-type N-terminal cleavage/methylation domain-containing protein [Nitrosomonadales bacterium]
MPTNPQYQIGFTLVEMAIVMFIMALALGTGLTLLSAQQDQRKIEDTASRLNDAREEIIGYAIASGRLPCPASITSNGLESFASGGSAANGNCSNFNNGFFPAATLGFTPVDSQGFAIDAWNNRIRYTVTAWSNASPSVPNAFTTTNGISAAWSSNLSPDLLVCSTATGISNTSCNGNALTSTPGVPAVIYSTGKNGAAYSTGIDEAANLDGNTIFVSHNITFAKDNPTNGEFDDQVIWLSPNILFNRMVQAGKLP